MPRNSRGRHASVRGREVSTRNLRFSERQIGFILARAAAASPRRPGRSCGIRARGNERLVDIVKKVGRG